MPFKIFNYINHIAVSLFIVVVVDIIFFNSRLKEMLPNNITSIAFYYAIFGFPHIIASFFGYLNKGYLAHYKEKLASHFLLNFLLIIFFLFFFPKLFIYFFIAYTLYHVAWQQIGIARKFFTDQKLYKLWSLSGVSSAVLFGLSIGGETGAFLPENTAQLLTTSGIIALAIFIITSILSYKGGEFVRMTSLLIIFASLSIIFGYELIGILMTRLAHDLTAFSIYATHDKNYQQNRGDNYFYSLFRIQPKYIFFALPLTAILLSYLLHSFNNILIVIIIALFSFVHYSMEGKAWKKGTPHRETIA